MKKNIILVLVSILVLGFSVCASATVLEKGTSVVKVSEDINVGSTLHFKDLVAIRGNIYVRGIIDHDVFALLGDVHLYPSAKVGGDVVSIGGKIVKDEGAEVGGNIVETTMSGETAAAFSSYIPAIGVAMILGSLLFKVMMFIGFLGLAILLAALMTKQVGQISYKIESGWLKSLLWGVLFALLICPVAALLAITIIGIPLIIVEFVIVSYAMALGLVSASQLIGKKVFKAFRKTGRPIISEAVLGIVVLFLIDLIPIIGKLVWCVVALMGFGAAISTKLGMEK